MNDRYLYRAKRTDNEKWAEGFLMDDNYINTPFNDNDVGGRFDDPVEIDPSTICQCTGLVDKNGKLIWENDILAGHIDDMYPENATYTQAIWYKNGFYTKEKGSDDILLIDEFDEKYFEVFGNVFDNPELLEWKGCD